MKLLVIDSKQVPLAEDYERILSTLPEEDRLRAERFKRQDDRIRCIAGAALIRKSVEQTLRSQGNEAVFHIARTDFGKPYVKEFPGIQFSISHSGRMIVYAESDNAVGVDVEELKKTDISDFESFFSSDEMHLIRSAEDPVTMFYRIWTVKEAFSKQTGIGLPLFETEKVEIDYDNERIIFHGEMLSFKTFLLDSHVMSVCATDKLEDVIPFFITDKMLK